MNRRDHLEGSGLGIGAIDVVAADHDVVEAFLSPLVRNVAREFVIARRTGDVGFGGKYVMLFAFFVRSGNCFEFTLNLGFASGRGGSESKDRSLRLRKQRGTGRENQNRCGANNGQRPPGEAHVRHLLVKRVNATEMMSRFLLLRFVYLRQQVRLRFVAYKVWVTVSAVVIELIGFVIIGVLNQ